MSARVLAVGFDALDPPGLARFWAGVLHWQLIDEHSDGIALLPDDDTGLPLRFDATKEPKVGPNQMHFDLTSTSLADQSETVARALALGARHIDVGQRPEEGHVVLADPEGNEFCVTEPGNRFLAGCGFLGALSCDGSREVGYFWSKALDWPLVWDQDEETAIHSPHGGPKISWGGPPDAPKSGKNRLCLHLAAPDQGDDWRDEADRLLSLGARRVDTGQGDARALAMADPGGNEFFLRTSVIARSGLG